VLQAGRTRIRLPMRSLDFSLDLILPALTSTQLLTEKSKMNLPWGVKGGRPARKADSLTAICEVIVQKMWEPRRLSTLWATTTYYRDSLPCVGERNVWISSDSQN
jgi:hypothetical protein